MTRTKLISFEQRITSFTSVSMATTRQNKSQTTRASVREPWSILLMAVYALFRATSIYSSFTGMK